MKQELAYSNQALYVCCLKSSTAWVPQLQNGKTRPENSQDSGTSVSWDRDGHPGALQACHTKNRQLLGYSHAKIMPISSQEGSSTVLWIQNQFLEYIKKVYFLPTWEPVFIATPRKLKFKVQLKLLRFQTVEILSYLFSLKDVWRQGMHKLPLNRKAIFI